MNRRQLLKNVALTSGALATLPLIAQRLSLAADEAPGNDAFPPVDISRSEWKALLEPKRFRILFEDGTEPAFSSPLDKIYEPGSYICAACYLPLFDSEDKYDSGTGWPSFTRPIEGRMDTSRDFKLIIPRTEYHCVRCGGHQGHVFDDGPPPTGKRWCNNGLALKFIPADDDLPPLRTSA